jgi:hypothetical protein
VMELVVVPLIVLWQGRVRGVSSIKRPENR